MGGRGASSASYGDGWRTVLESGNIKFLESNGSPGKVPDYTRVKGRVYVTLNSKGGLKSISYYNASGVKKRQLDLDRPHGGKSPHSHTFWSTISMHRPDISESLSAKEQRLVDRVERVWKNRQK